MPSSATPMPAARSLTTMLVEVPIRVVVPARIDMNESGSSTLDGLLPARLVAAIKHLVTPLADELSASLRACGQARHTVRYEDGTAQERTRAFFPPLADRARPLSALEQLLGQLSWPAPAIGLHVALEQIQEAVLEQLSFLPAEEGGEDKLCQVQRYLAARFGANCLRRVILAQPNAPLPEWRVGWDAISSERPT